MLTPRPSILILDAMGVIYRVGDDVADLLVPFIQEKGGSDDPQRIDATYLEASLGRITARQFWQRVGLSDDLEDEYLARFELSDGLAELLDAAPDRFASIVCLSNDVSEWSRKLRQRFSLERRFAGWYISGDLGIRKPDPQIYAHLLSDLHADPGRVVFVDDRTKNLDPAAELGIQTVHYDAAGPPHTGKHQTIHRLGALLHPSS